MRFNNCITNQDRLGFLLKANRPLPIPLYCLCVENALNKITAQPDILPLQEKNQRIKKIYIWKYAVSIVAIAVIIIGITFGYSLFGQQQNPIIAENIHEVTPSMIPSPIKVQLTVQERVVKEQEYGTVSLSMRSLAEVQALMQLTGVPDEEVDKVHCYEDERYVYFFYGDGTVAGIMASYLNDNTFDPDTVWSKVHLSEDEAIAIAKETLLKYCDTYSEDTAERFTVEAWNADADDIPHYPEWSITFKEHTQNGICRNTILVEIDMYGKIATVLFGVRSNVSDEQLEQNVYISEETAISLALAQFKKEERGVDLEHFSVTATLVEHNGTVEWVLFFEEIADEEGKYLFGWKQSYWMLLDAVSGEWIRTDISR